MRDDAKTNKGLKAWATVRRAQALRDRVFWWAFVRTRQKDGSVVTAKRLQTLQVLEPRADAQEPSKVDVWKGVWEDHHQQ